MSKQTTSEKPISSTKRAFFYIPGVFGDEPKQVVLREKMLGEFSIILLDLPDLNLDRAILCDLSKTGRIVAENITKIQRKGNIHLLGFSFGASLAIEVACHLTRAGRKVAYLGLIDCPLRIQEKRRSVRGTVELLTAPHGMGFVLKNIGQVLKRIYNARIGVKLFGHEQSSNALAECRFEALRNWNPQVCEAPGVILLSIFNFERSHESWQLTCPNCRLIKIRTDHQHVLIGSSLDHVAAVMGDEISKFLRKSE